MTIIEIPMRLTDDQKAAENYIKEFIISPFCANNPDSYLCTLSGSAGTGKTTLTKIVVRMVRKAGKQVLCVAPTHKARKVLDSIINTSCFLRIPTSTVAGLLGKMRAHGYVGTQNYVKSMDTKIGMYDFFIVDEISMVTSSDYDEITKLAKLYEKKILFVGDHLQIPNPSQCYIEQNGCLVKEINPAFRTPHQLHLREVVRTDNTNPLSSLLRKIRDHVGTGFNIADFKESETIHMGETPMDNKGYLLIEEHSIFLKAIKSSALLFATGQYRVISYTNHSVKQYNKLIRSALGYTDNIVKGELLTGYSNVGPNNDLIVENGQDYYVTNINAVCNRTVSANGRLHEGLSGKILAIREREALADRPDSSHVNVDVNIFLLDLDDPNNFDLLEELVHLADKVNCKGSTKTDYRNYITLKSQLVFMEDIYRYKNNIYTGVEFKALHPLLFTKTTAVLTTRGDTIASELINKLDDQYPGLLDKRVSDNNKKICQSETLADMYQVLERDISYGYALTSHKSQGSTYHSVFIDEPDFNSLKDQWSWKYQKDIRRATERDQLKYVALSRPTNVCYVHVTKA